MALTSVIFFTVCGGAFGIESLIGKLGAGWAIALIILTPLLWSLPIALMVSELASAMPEEGGYASKNPTFRGRSRFAVAGPF